MFAFIARRLGTLVVILFGSSFLLYNLTAISGDPTEYLKFSTDPKDVYQLHALVRQLNLDTPPPIRYFLWLKGILGGFVGHLNMGLTRDGLPVTYRLQGAIPTTFRLVTIAALTALVLGIILGIITALRQYSRFDYVVTFFSFLMFSLPIFWVAVLLKEFMAIRFNDFLVHPKISIIWILIFSIIAGFFWAGVIGGSRKRFLQIFGGVVVSNALLLQTFNWINWFANPRFGIVVVGGLSVGIAYAITAASVGLEMKPALKSSLTMAGITTMLYYPLQMLFKNHANFPTLIFLALLTAGTAVGVSMFFAKIDRRAVVRTTIISGLLMGMIVFIDRLMQAWGPYNLSDGVSGRPIPTIGENNPQLSSTDFWITTLDRGVHLLLPTIALTLISFAGYIRFSRGTLLEVLNQDYIRTARAKGLSERTVIVRHAVRNTMIPLTTIIVVDLAGIIGGAIITERVFGWHGMGTLFNEAINILDLNLLMGVFFCTASLSVLANLVADLLYSALDPRIRVGSK
jgi:peptide/nickel transport system permease protein